MRLSLIGMRFDAGEINTSKILIANLPYNISVPLIMRFCNIKYFQTMRFDSKRSL